MKLFAIIFLSIGVLFAIIGLSWFYFALINQESTGFSELWIGPMVFTFIGLLFSSIGGGILYSQARQKARREYLLRSGRKVRAAISNVSYNTSISINNRHPQIIECVAEISGQKKTFKSHNVWGNVQFTVGQEIVLYVDTRDASNYWVDVGE
jgi:hypothetical protein